MDYFSKEAYSPDPNDSTMAIPYAVTRSMVFFMAATALLCCGYWCCVLGQCWRHRLLCTFVSGLLFIVSGLVMLFGLVMYISVFKAEVGGKLRPRSQLQPPRFTYRYGYSFLLYVSGFVSTELAGVSAVFLFLQHQQRGWQRRQLRDARRAAKGRAPPPTVHYLVGLEPAALYPCRRHPHAYVNSTSAIQLQLPLPLRHPASPARHKRYYFHKEPAAPESPCSLHAGDPRAAPPKEPAAGAYEWPPPPPSALAGTPLPRDLTANTVSTTADVNCDDFLPPDHFDDYSPGLQHEADFVTFDLDAPLPLRAQSAASISSRCARKDAAAAAAAADSMRRTTPV